MRRKDLELITALAEGSLEDETEARSLIASSPRLRAEYEAQKAAIDALASMGQPRLSEHEKADLHRIVWSEITAHPRPAQRAVPWYYRWSYVAAGLFVVVGLVAVLTQVGEDPATEMLAEPTSGVDRGADASAPAADSGDSDGGTVEEASAGGALDDDAIDSDRFLAYFSEQATRLRQGETTETPGVTSQAAAEKHASCLESAGLGGYVAVDEVIPDDAVDEPKVYIMAVPSAAEISQETPIVFVDAATCSIAHTDG